MKKILLFIAGLMLAMTASAEITLYFVNAGGWGNVNAYVWPTGADGIVAWPGEAATKTDETAKGFDVYSYTFDETLADNVIFNDGSAQTDNLTFDASKPYCYGEEWYASIEEIEGAGELPTYEYYIAGEKVDGTEWVCGKNWNPSGCGLANNTITYTALPAGEYKFKITNGAWPNADGTGGTCWGFEALSTTLSEISSTDDGNVVITLTSAADVTISFDGSSISVSINGETGDDNTGDDNTGDDNTGDDNTGDDNTGDDNTGDDITPSSTTYYLIGYINGADYGCEADAENMGDYKFVDGTLTATFEVDSYVFVKTEGNTDWFMSDGFDQESPATLINTKNTLTDYNKLMVPGGVEVTFTLVENADGTLTLSYTTGTATDLEDVDAEDAVVAAYDLLGRPVAADAAGYVILQYASGKAVKVFNN